MNRRGFLQHAFPILLWPSALSACVPNEHIKPNGKSVLIIGAGISGLAAAQELRREGFKVTIIEAQDRVGGRLRTDRSLGLAFDEGASWIHGPKGNPITDLAAEAGMKTFLTDDDSLEIFDFDGKPYADDFFSAEEEKYTAIMATLLNKGRVDQSVESVFFAQYPQYQNNRLWNYFLSAYLTFDLGDLNELSSLDYDAGENFRGADVIATNGYDTIANFLAKNLSIQFNERVSAIEYGEAQVVVRTNKTRYSADYVLVSVPLGVLKKNSIGFSPALPVRKQAAIDRLKMNCVNKFLLLWDRAFWNPNTQYIAYTSTQRDKFNYFLNMRKFTPNNALMTFAFGDYARQTEVQSDTQIIGEIMPHLRAIYGNSTPLPKAMLRTRWNSNPHSFGSYSFPSKGARVSDFSILAESIANKVFFAGEHTEADYFGTVHGAYLSGIREAEKIVDL